MKAYLAHSHDDKAYVDIVARRLTRARVIYDTYSFLPGQDFRDAIREGLQRSSLFVLFASEKSLASSWVRFEIDEAEIRRISMQLHGALVFGIDSKVRPQDLPEWMRRGRALFGTRPSQAARHILSQLLFQTGRERDQLFIGREDTLRNLAEILVPAGGDRPPNVVVASGLDGIGRRSALRRALKDNLFLEVGPTIHLDESDSIDRLYLGLVRETMELSPRSQLTEAMREFGSATTAEQAKLLAAQLLAIAADNVATLVVDEEGALLDEAGRFTPDAQALFAELEKEDADAILALVERRRPTEDGRIGARKRVGAVTVPPLALDATRRLLLQSFKAGGLGAPTSTQVEDLLPYLGGYPPAVNLVVGFSTLYGLPALLADKAILVDFKVRAMARIVERLSLTSAEKLLCRILGLEPAVSIDALAIVAELPLPDVGRSIRRLIDLSLVVHEAGLYGLAGPVRDVIYRTFGYFDEGEFTKMAASLRATYWADPQMVPTLDVVDLTIHAAARGAREQLAELSDLILPSNLLRVAREAYNQRRWALAKEFADRASSSEALRGRALEISAKAAVRLAYEGAGSWSEAEHVVAGVERQGIRGHRYLRGFMEWKRGNLEKAVEAYTAAANARERGVGVFRDRAHCLFRLGRTEEAQRDIAIALERYPRNRYVVDLAAQIAIARGQWKEADELVSELEQVDVRENFLHRRATLKATRGQFVAALEDIEEAAKREPPLHEILATRADILIELKEYGKAAAAIEDLRHRFRGSRSADVAAGLSCKLNLRRGDWKAAEREYSQLREKGLPVHKALREELLRLRLELDRELNASQGEDLKAELERLGEGKGIHSWFDADGEDA